jgi:GTP cyclohydrolase I
VAQDPQDRGAAAVREILIAIGEDPDREGLRDTPARVARSWAELFAGYQQDPADVLVTTFGDVEGYDDLILLKDIPFYSTCEHHMLPFIGVAHVAYLPKDRVVGLSKLARLVDVYARRLQIQERMTQEIARAIMEHLQPLGCAVVIEATHGCMVCRGVRKEGAKMVTSALKGDFQNPATRAEFLALIR